MYIIRAAYAFENTLDYKLSRTFILGLFFAIGYLIKEYIEVFRKCHCPALWAASTISFLLIGTFTIARISSNKFTSPLLYVVGALAGSYCLICLSQWIEKRDGGYSM